MLGTGQLETCHGAEPSLTPPDLCTDDPQERIIADVGALSGLTCRGSATSIREFRHRISNSMSRSRGITVVIDASRPCELNEIILLLTCFHSLLERW
jgi:hypothetical protein